MKALIFETENGSIDLIGDTEIRLLTPPGLEGVSAKAQINTQETGDKDGSTYMSGKYTERSIIVPFRIRNGADAERAQYDLYRIFAPKVKGTMTMHARTCSSRINFIVEEVNCPPNQRNITGRIVLRCPDPFFRALKEEKTIIAGSSSFFKFPFVFPSEPFYISKRQDSVFKEIINDGVSETEWTLYFYAKARVVNPYLENVNTGEKMQLSFSMEAGDTVRITTGKDNKKVTLIRHGEEINIYNFRKFPFYFLQLAAGRNLFKFGADSGVNNLEITAEYSAKFPGIYCNIPGGTERISDTEISAKINEIARIVKRGGLYG